MGSIEDIKEILDHNDLSQKSRLVEIDSVVNSAILFTCTSLEVDVDIEIMSTSVPTVEVVFNGEPMYYKSNFISFTHKTNKNNRLVVNIKSGGLLSKRIKIVGSGVELLN